MDEAAALAKLAGTDERAAQAAYGWLCDRSRRYLHACLRQMLPDAQDREDAIQESLLRVWGARAQFRDRGFAAWLGFLRTTAQRCAIDQLRGRRGAEDVPIEEVPDEDLELIDELLPRLTVALDAGALYDRANSLWLGLDATLAPETHTRQLLAAQLFYLDGEPWEAVVRLLGTAPGEPPLARERLDAWLCDEGVLRYLAYQEVYYANDRLCTHLLGLPDPAAPGQLDEVVRQAAAVSPDAAGPGGWTWGEAAILCWRYRYALLVEQILARQDCACDPEELRSLLERSRACFPFCHRMACLLHALEAQPGLAPRSPFGQPGLWQRLAFQYWWREELPQRDIQERTQPAADLVNYTLSAGTLNMWLSGGRLLKRLADCCAVERGGE